VAGSRRFGRFGEPAVWVLVALAGGPRGASGLLDEIRDNDGPVGPGTLYGALARLERYGLIEAATNGAGRAAYRLMSRGAARLDPGGGVT
jgi:DNA-binding PadR family transcriptional regulator